MAHQTMRELERDLVVTECQGLCKLGCLRIWLMMTRSPLLRRSSGCVPSPSS